MLVEIEKRYLQLHTSTSNITARQFMHKTISIKIYIRILHCSACYKHYISVCYN